MATPKPQARHRGLRCPSPGLPGIIIEFALFYGLGYLYPDNSLDRVRYAPSGGGLTEAVNAMSSQSGFIDTVGTPIYGDGRNFSYIEVIIVD